MASKKTESRSDHHPLHVAAESGDVPKVRKILKQGKYSVDGIDSSGKTPLHYACAKGHLNLVRVLVSKF